MPMDHIESVKFVHRLSDVLRYGKGFPGGKKIKENYKLHKSICKKKVEKLRSLGKSKEAHQLEWKCEVAALCKYVNSAMALVKKHGPTHCNKYDNEKKKICTDNLKIEVGNLKHECDSAKKSMKIELKENYMLYAKGALTVASAVGIIYKSAMVIYKMYYSEEAKKCKGKKLINQEKALCIKKAQRDALSKQIEKIMAIKKQCNKSTNPEKCFEEIESKLLKLKAKRKSL